jgi:hypothetical protein
MLQQPDPGYLSLRSPGSPYSWVITHGTLCSKRQYLFQFINFKQLRIHNITAKAALKFGSEAWVLRKREKQRLEAAQIKFWNEVPYRTLHSRRLANES